MDLFICFQGMESVKKEIGDLGHTGPYRPPARLRKRSEFSSKGAGDDSKVFEANEYVSALCFALIVRGERLSGSEIASITYMGADSLIINIKDTGSETDKL